MIAAPPPDPCRDRPAALERAAALQALDGGEVNPLCRSQVLEPGARTARAFVLLHGYTNCPRQFVPLGRRIAARGAAVVIPRYPHHGLADRMTRDQGRLTAAELVRAASTAVDIAAGLGERVTVIGLSLGGVLAAWLAHNRAGLDRALLLAPLFRARLLPGWSHGAAAAAMVRLPPVYLWWSPRREAVEPAYGYPRFATRGFGAMLAIGRSVTRQARSAAPLCRSLACVWTEGDQAVDNRATADLVGLWRRHGAQVEVVIHPRADGVPHDMVDPNQPDQRTDLVYPEVERLAGLSTGR